MRGNSTIHNINSGTATHFTRMVQLSVTGCLRRQKKKIITETSNPEPNNRTPEN